MARRAVALLVCLALLSACGSSEQETEGAGPDGPAAGEIGGPPASDFPSPSELSAGAKSEAVVIAPAGPDGIELVAFKDENGPCIYESSGGGVAGSCGLFASDYGTQIEAQGLGGGGDNHTVHGSTSPRVASVRAGYRSPSGAARCSKALFTRVDGDLLETIGAEHPFGYFVAAFRDEIPQESVVAVALNKDGDIIGHAKTTAVSLEERDLTPPPASCLPPARGVQGDN